MPGRPTKAVAILLEGIVPWRPAAAIMPEESVPCRPAAAIVPEEVVLCRPAAAIVPEEVVVCRPAKAADARPTAPIPTIFTAPLVTSRRASAARCPLKPFDAVVP
ncbi:hypothetical protein GCM10009555_077840 [Acrocarpospora macrocephala]|uniref:Uncharacterized protein n=1 Tax=Acrocarpospora macrocephala TaxID=150177 RepID=A0A5M3X867_9ACTN|nr:hypothetical protein Amac_093190 [Acrocarpospora macrocephala]